MVRSVLPFIYYQEINTHQVAGNLHLGGFSVFLCYTKYMNKQEDLGKKVIVESAEGTPTSATFRQSESPGFLRTKFKENIKELNLDEIIQRCPKDFLPTLVKCIQDIKLQYNSNERELTMVAEALVESRLQYIEGKVKNPITPEEAIKEIHEILTQKESNTFH